MSVPFKKMLRKDPRKPQEAGKYYPHIVGAGKAAQLSNVIYLIKAKSSLSQGDIRSVLVNFVEVLRNLLFSGKSVNVENFGVFSLSCESDGVDKREECTAKNIRSLHINFRPSTSVRPDLSAPATRADGEAIDFYDVEEYITVKEEEDDETIDPGA